MAAVPAEWPALRAVRSGAFPGLSLRSLPSRRGGRASPRQEVQLPFLLEHSEINQPPSQTRARASADWPRLSHKKTP